MKLEINVPDEAIRRAVKSAAHDAIPDIASNFIQPDKCHNSDSRREVRDRVEGLALAEILCTVSRKVLQAEVREAIADAIRAEMKSQARWLLD